MTDDLYDIVHDAVAWVLDKYYYVGGFAEWAGKWRAGRYDERYTPDPTGPGELDAYRVVLAVYHYERAKRLDALLARTSKLAPQREWIVKNAQEAQAMAREWAAKVGKGDDDAD